MYPEIPVLSFISATLSLVPLIWYLRARNIAALAIGVWLFLTNLTYAVGALVWAGDADIKASTWCDISTSFVTGSRIGLPAACLCICIHLERLASFCLTSTPQAKRRRIIFECLMCFGLPLAYIILHLVVQPRRFDLFHGFGCRPATIAAVFLVMIPPLFLTVATIVYAGIARRHFVVHGIRFYGKRGSISSPTRNLYLRLVGMAVLEAVLSAVLIAVVMRGVLSPGLAPMTDMPRDLSEVLVWSSETLTSSVRTTLQVEWSLTAVQSIAFFGLFACRMEVMHEVWEFIHSFLQSLKGSKLSAGASERSSTSSSITVPTLPLTEVDLSLVIQSASTLTPYGESACRLPSARHLSHPPSCAGDISEVATSTIAPVAPLKSPSRAPAIVASHSSLVSNFDPLLSPDAWPRTPTAIPVHFLHLSRGLDARQFEGSWSDMEVPFPRARLASHVRSCTTDVFGEGRWYGPEKCHAIYVRETR